MQLKGHLNVAACHLKLGQHYETVRACEKALEIDHDNVKAYFRRGQVGHSLLMLTVRLADGSVRVVCTDGEWQNE